jgi:hypothetical protein
VAAPFLADLAGGNDGTQSALPAAREVSMGFLRYWCRAFLFGSLAAIGCGDDADKLAQRTSALVPVGGGGGGDDGCDVSCPDSTVCAQWTFNVDACACDVVYAPTTTSCDDHDPCTSGDHCSGGGSCTSTSVPAGTACDDGNSCTTNDVCMSSGSCAGTYTACPPPTFTWTISSPNVNQPVTDYPSYRFLPGDVITVNAGGCVQTGGSGPTWKRYVVPSGGNADRLYHGRIWIPGATMGLETLQSIINRGPITVATPAPGYDPAQMFLRLGYDDDNYGDNGYWGHDDGTDGQCSNIYSAWVQITVARYGGLGQTRTCPSSVPIKRYEDLYWSSLDANGLPLNPTFGKKCGPGGSTADVENDCGPQWVDSGRVAVPQCTSFFPTTDTKDSPLCNPFDGECLCYSTSTSGNVNGHGNFGFATYSGVIYWKDYDDPFFHDDDFNFLVKVDNDEASLTVHNESIPYRGINDPNVGKRALQLEMAAYETVHRGDYADTTGVHPGGYRPGGWSTLAYGSNSDRIWLLDRKPVVAIGLVGFDFVHDIATELHPLLGLAVRTQAPNAANGYQEVWMIMARRSGNEGECSHDDVAPTHGFSAPFMRFSLPTINKHVSSSQFYDGWSPVSAWASQPTPGPTLLSVQNPPDGHVVLGEIHFSP